MIKRLMFSIILFLIGFVSCKQTKSKVTSITLSGNPTTGYTWEYFLEDESLVSVEEQVFYKGNDGRIGAPSDFIYHFTGIKEGETSVIFEYKRPWENNPPISRKVFSVKVHSDKSVDIKETN